ncbi:S8 family serine peptidase [Halovivax gelatinilyticus]|uniref:S8 family serine peptidase n=1 Tax=Halovivax gelatinilyticus TaxID=2961597 RepID=UPI0020CA2F7F|nr:S8 family serine peptidase [Halovivax gelatinilyticus]
MPSQANVVHENDVLGYVVVEVPIPEVGTADDAISTLEAQSAVEYAEENVTFHALDTANANDPGFDQQYAPQQVDAPDAWNTTQGEDTLVSIVDTGTDYNHEDLQDRFGSDPGYDFVGGTNDPAPRASSESHGTHVAGCAAATTNNGVGIAGVSNAQLIAARVLGTDGSGSLYDIADGIQWSADQGADIINMSLGGGGFTDLMNDAINYAFNSGSLPIAAAGNDGGPVNYPAAYDNCVAVSAIDSNYNAASFTSRGSNVDVCAGGVNVLSAVPNDGYQEMSGTSMACPVAAGVAALGASAHGLTGNSQDPGQLWNLLTSTAESVQGLPADVEGDGLANAANIVDGGGGDPPDEPTAVIDVSTTSPEVGETVDLDGTGSSSPNGQITDYQWTADPGGSVSGPTASLTRDEEVAIDVTLTITDEAGGTDSDTVTVDFGGDGDAPGECGAETNTASAEGELSDGWWGNPSDSYTYSLSTADPCAATVTLDGPSSGAVFDLYLTLDGREPSTWDYDERSYNWGADEEIQVDLDGSETLGILVDRYDGSGSYTLTVEELGK